jgi:hypothetical protein
VETEEVAGKIVKWSADTRTIIIGGFLERAYENYGNFGNIIQYRNLRRKPPKLEKLLPVVLPRKK